MEDQDKTIDSEELEPSAGVNHTASTYQETQVNLWSNGEHPNCFFKEETIYFQIYRRIMFSSFSITQLTILPIYNPRIRAVQVRCEYQFSRYSLAAGLIWGWKNGEPVKFLVFSTQPLV